MRFSSTKAPRAARPPRRWRRLLPALCGGLLLLQAAEAGAQEKADPLASPTFGSWGVDFSWRDPAVRPGDDFYRYQNGKWLDQVKFGPNQLADAFWRDLRLLAPRRVGAELEALAATPSLSAATPQGKAAAVYRAYLDETTAESRGFAPLKAEIDEIAAIGTRSQMAAFMGRLAGPETLRAPSVYGPPVGWSFFRLDNVDQDRAQLGRYALYVGAGGLPLPGPEYYSEAQFADLRRAYVEYIATMLKLEGWPDADARAAQVLALETEIARVSWSHQQMLDTAATYNPVAVEDLASLAPGFDWRAYFAGAGASGVKTVVIDAKSAFPAIADIFARTPLEVLKAKAAFAVADQRSLFLDSRALAAGIAFRGKALGDGVYAGAAPRKYRAEKETEAALPDIVSALYVARYSSPQTKATVEKMAEAMRVALDARLQQVSWMSPDHRAAARAKLHAMRFHIGYPTRFDDYAGLEVAAGDLYGNHMRAAAYQWRTLVARLDRPFDDTRWAIRAEYPTFNYVQTTNTVEIPAALLVAPFFDDRADPAVNYGGAGTILGAMIASPFFTKQGLSYDGDGRLKAWLTPEETAAFSSISARIAAQYSAVEPLPGFHLKGELLSDEALGDLAGLQIALDAYRGQNAGAARLDGYSGDQRFFLGRAQMWRAKFVESFVRSQIATGSNEPPFMRVNGLFPNMDAWYDAFEVKPGDRMYIAPGQRVRLW